MKYRSALFALLLLFAVLPARADYTAIIDPADRHQIFEGWGTSLCWWANVVGGFPDAIRSDYMTKIFDPAQGLGMTVARYNIGGGENPAIPNTLQYRARMPGFEPKEGVWDWSADANQRRILFEAQRKGVNLTEAFANSPPYWMTISGSVAGASDGGANLRPECGGKFADYLAEVVKQYHDRWGVTFRTLEPMNESTTTYWKKGGSQEGYHIDPVNARHTDQNTLVKKTAAALRRRGLRTQVSANDDTSINLTAESVRTYDRQAKASIVQINTHTYSGSRRAALHTLAQTLHKRLWMSEHGDGDATGLTMARDILDDLKVMQCSAWVYWQAVDIKGWGMLENRLRTPHSYAYTLSRKYYVMAQFSRFIRPGCRFIGMDDNNSVAAYRPSDRRLVIVTLNSGKSDVLVTYNLSKFRHLPAKVSLWRTSPTESLAKQPDIAITAGHLTTSLKAGSVTTCVAADIF